MMALKLDMSKAYDRVEWDFLQLTIEKMGFPPRWVTLVMKCVRTVSFSILINGYPTTSFVPQRGLRQGDPLSPYLFIICGEVFSAMIARKVANSTIHGIRVTPRAPTISHLFFAADSIIFTKATVQEAQAISSILEF